VRGHGCQRPRRCGGDRPAMASTILP
jgi:hypothetical protein